MSKVSTNQFAKLMADPKVGAILTATRSASGLTSKQISKATHIPTNQLYYTINKMLTADLLTVVDQVQVKNLTENYYSSAHPSQEKPAFKAELDQLNDVTDISSDWAQEHAPEIAQWLMLQHHNFLTAFEQQMAAKDPDPTVFASQSQLKLSAAGAHQLRLDLLHLIDNAEKADPDPNATTKRTINLNIEKW